MNIEVFCDFLECNRFLCSCFLNGIVKFEGDSVIDGGDIIGFFGGNLVDEENYFSNFVVDFYFKFIFMESLMKGVLIVFLKWE